MRAGKLRYWVAAGAVPAAIMTLAVPLGASTALASPGSRVQHTYIVILRDQNRQLHGRWSVRRTAAAAEQKPVVTQLRALGARQLGSTSIVNAIIARMTAADARTLAANPAVAEVIPDGVIRGPAPFSPQQAPAGSPAGAGPDVSQGLCGTAARPQLNPEALQNINAVQATQMGYDGAGVTVATLADGLNPADPDFQRNPAFASAGSPAGSPVVNYVDFSGSGLNAPTLGAEMFLDSSSVVAQGNQVYDLSQYVLPGLPAGCDIKIQGDAPGASMLALKVYGAGNKATYSGFLQAIDYAVASGAKVISESIGDESYPDLAGADVLRDADDAAVAQGVTVVDSSGDEGVNNTIISPASDPNVIGVGATTTLRSYEQDTYGGVDVPGANGRYVDNNISAFSSAGVTEAGRTVDLVAPGDLNWELCDPNVSVYASCTTFTDPSGTPIQLDGGTSESAPLTAGAAADVIQAYASAHGGTDPTPALVKEILLSTATDIDAPATQQGAGLLNIAAAVKMASSIGQPGSDGGVLVSPNQIDVTQQAGTTTSHPISVTNTSSHPVTVWLSTRQFTHQVADASGSFCMQPGTPTASCPANTGTFPLWTGDTAVYQKETFYVPPTTGASRLDFQADSQFFSSPLPTWLQNVALLEPDGTYAMFSSSQNIANYMTLQVADPPPGKWTAVFFTAQDNGPANIGTSGPVQWDASTVQSTPGGSISPATLYLPAGQAGTATLHLTSSSSAGDAAQSVVIRSGASQTTVPVVVRTPIPSTTNGGTFAGVLTGGNGRGSAQVNDYTFNVPKGATNLDAQVTLANDPGDILIAYLMDPDGANLGYSSNVTVDAAVNPQNVVFTRSVDLYHANPTPGEWTIVLQWANPVTGLELTEPFKGTISFAAPPISGNLPSGSQLQQGSTYLYTVTVHNYGQTPEAYFADPRLHSSQNVVLLNQNTRVDDSDIGLPLTLATNLPAPYYLVPTETSSLQETASSTVPITFDSGYLPGDPELPATSAGDSASLTYSAPVVSPGLWSLVPSEIGPFPADGEPAVSVSASMSATTKAFDPEVASTTGDFWQAAIGPAGADPLYLPAGATGTITVAFTPSGPVGSVHSGTLYIDDLTLAGLYGLSDPQGQFAFANGDEVTALPYSYRVAG
jgi:Subtilase family